MWIDYSLSWSSLSCSFYHGPMLFIVYALSHILTHIVRVFVSSLFLVCDIDLELIILCVRTKIRDLHFVSFISHISMTHSLLLWSLLKRGIFVDPLFLVVFLYFWFTSRLAPFSVFTFHYLFWNWKLRGALQEAVHFPYMKNIFGVPIAIALESSSDVTRRFSNQYVDFIDFTSIVLWFFEESKKVGGNDDYVIDKNGIFLVLEQTLHIS